MSDTAPSGKKRGHRFNLKNLNALSALTLWLLFGTGPAIILLVGFFIDAGGIEADAYPNFRRFSLLLNSAALAICVSVFCTGLAVLSVSRLRRFSKTRYGLLLWLPLVLIAVPHFVHASAWLEAGRLFNLTMVSVGFPAFSAPNWFLVFWVQSMSFFPVSYGFCLASMNRTDHALTDAGHIFNDSWLVLRKIELPLAIPVIMVGSSFVALLSLTDFSIPVLFQMRSYAMEIFVTYSAGAGEKTTFLLALPLLALCLIIILFLLRRIEHTEILPDTRPREQQSSEYLPPWFRNLQILAIVILCLQVAVPLIVLIFSSGPFSAFMDAIWSAKQEIGSSFITAIATSIGSVILALFLFTRLNNKWWLLLCLLPLAFPATLTGIGLIKLWNHPQTNFVYGSSLMPVFASIARFSPICVLVLHYFDRSVARELSDAARVFRGNGIARWRYILLPLYLPGLIAGFLIVFALTLGELPATLLVAPP